MTQYEEAIRVVEELLYESAQLFKECEVGNDVVSVNTHPGIPLIRNGELGYYLRKLEEWLKATRKRRQKFK